MARVFPVAERLLAAPDLQRFFDPALYRRAWNEIEITTPDGKLVRIDRLVEDHEAVWVLDYKSGARSAKRVDDYRIQVVAYCDIVANLGFAKRVQGLLLFGDGSVERIEFVDRRPIA
jgi:ATP-dependent helicase/nuclease subunit A